MLHNTPFYSRDFDVDFDANVEAKEVRDILKGHIARQREQDGVDSSVKLAEVRALPDQWKISPDEHRLQQWRGMVARSMPGKKPQVVDTSERWNDADVLGEDSPEWQALLQQEITPSFGKLFTSENEKRKSTRRDAWKGRTVAVKRLIDGSAEKNAFFAADRREALGLSRSSEGDKAGPGYVFGNCLGNRTTAGVQSICALWIDHDSGHVTFDKFVSNASECGYAFAAYETHSNGTIRTELKRADVVKHAKCGSDPTLEQVQAFVHAKKGYADHIIGSMQIEEQRQTTESGEMIVVSHAPIPKFRAVFFLAEGDIPLAGPESIANTQEKAQEIVKNKLRGLADMVKTPTDPGALDVSRFLFAARHPKGRTQRVVIHRGPAIAFADVREVYDTKASNSQWQRREDVISTDGTNVTALYNRYGKRWMLAEIAEHCDLGTSADANNAGEVFHVRCPFADGHTDSVDDSATIVINAEDAEHEFAVCKCMHGSCGNRHITDYLAAWIDAGDLTVDILEDPAFMMPLPDNAKEEKFLRLTPEETKGTAEARTILRKQIETVDGVSGVSESGVEAAIAKLEALGLSNEGARERVLAVKADIERQLEEREADRQFDPVAAARADARAEGDMPHVLDAIYDEALVDEDGFLLKPENAENLYRDYGIKPTSDRAFEKMQRKIRKQMFRNLNARFNYVVLDGETKLAIPQPQGEAIKLRKEATLTKLYRNRAVSYWDESGKTPKVKKIYPAQVYVDERTRLTYLDTCFEPNPKKAETAARSGAFNLWNGFAATPQPGDWSLLRGHIFDNICGGNAEYFNFVLTWLASLFARPGIKVPSSLAIIGEQGTGKSKLFDWIRRAIGSAALKVSSGRHLTGNFNAHLDGLIFLVCEEAFWAGDRSAGGVMKDLISSGTLQIEGKFANLIERPNYVNIVFISNNKWAVPVDGEDARRFFVLECSNARKQDAAFFGAIDDQMENGGVEAMMHELMHWNPADVHLTWQSLRTPPATDFLRQQAGMGLNGPAARLVAILEAGVLQGRTKAGDVFYYDLDEDFPTTVARAHLVAVLESDDKHGNLSAEMKNAVNTFLGEGADQGDKKAVIDYLGELISGEDARTERATSSRERHVIIPPLNILRGEDGMLTRYGRG